MVRTSQTLEQDKLKLVSFQDLEIFFGRLKKIRQETAQEREFQIRRDADRFSQPVTNELLDDPVGHDDRHPLQRIVPLMRRNSLCQRRDQIFESI